MEMLRKNSTHEQQQSNTRPSLDPIKVIMAVGALMTATVAFGNAAINWYGEAKNVQRQEKVEDKADAATESAKTSYDVLVVELRELKRRAGQLEEDVRFLLKRELPPRVARRELATREEADTAALADVQQQIQEIVELEPVARVEEAALLMVEPIPALIPKKVEMPLFDQIQKAAVKKVRKQRSARQSR